MVGPSFGMRASLLAAQVLDGLDIEFTDDGIVLGGGSAIAVDWATLRMAVGDTPPISDNGRALMVSWLEVRRMVNDLPLALLVESIRPVGLPVGHSEHPGDDWVMERVLGQALDLGIGVLGLDPTRPDDVLLVASSVWAHAGYDERRWWAPAQRRLEDMGMLAARRWAVNAEGVLRPMGDCDVVTLLGARSLRTELAGTDGGMRAIVVPMRRRGWTSLSRLDPAFGPAAAMATDPAERGFVRPVLVTPDEVVLAGDGGNTTISLRDKDASDPHTQQVTYR